MIEVSDLRTRPWGYRSQEIATCLRNVDYELFRALPGGKLEPIDKSHIEDGSDFNVIAAPRERSREIAHFLADQGKEEDDLRSEVVASSKS
jgi:hypothetical protein